MLFSAACWKGLHMSMGVRRTRCIQTLLLRRLRYSGDRRNGVEFAAWTTPRSDPSVAPMSLALLEPIFKKYRSFFETFLTYHLFPCFYQNLSRHTVWGLFGIKSITGTSDVSRLAQKLSTSNAWHLCSGHEVLKMLLIVASWPALLSCLIVGI
jgi:hypothetical protein